MRISGLNHPKLVLALRMACLFVGIGLATTGTAVAGEAPYSPAFADLDDELRTRFLGALRHATHIHPTQHDDEQLWPLRRLESDFRLDLDYRVRRDARISQEPRAAGLLRVGRPGGVDSVPYQSQSLKDTLEKVPEKAFLQPAYYLYTMRLRHAAAQCRPDEKEQNLAFFDFVVAQDWSAGKRRYQATPYEVALMMKEYGCISERTFHLLVSDYVKTLLAQLESFERPGDRLRPLFLLAAGGMLDRVGKEKLLEWVRLQGADGSWPGADFDGSRAAAAQGAYVLARWLKQKGQGPTQSDLLGTETPVLPATDWRRPAPP